MAMTIQHFTIRRQVKNGRWRTCTMWNQSFSSTGVAIPDRINCQVLFCLNLIDVWGISFLAVQ